MEKWAAFSEVLSESEVTIQYCLAAPSFLRNINVTLPNKDFVQLIANKLKKGQDLGTIPKFFDANDNTAAFLFDDNCNRMILRCMWARKTIPCNEIFTGSTTQHGDCCVFNLLEGEMLLQAP